MNKLINWLKSLFGIKPKQSVDEETAVGKQVTNVQKRTMQEDAEEHKEIEQEDVEEQGRIKRETIEEKNKAEEKTGSEEKNKAEEKQEISDNFINNGGSLGPIININNYIFDGELDSSYPTTHGVYIVSNIANKRVLYVGQTSNLRRRFAEHLKSGKFKEYGIVFEYISMPDASYNELNIKEAELIEKLNPLLNVQSGGGNTNKTSIITYTDWNGRGAIKSFADVSEMRKYIVGITGKIQGYSRNDIVTTLQQHGVDIKDKRKSISTDLWIVGKDGKVGATKNNMIEDRDFVMTHDNIVDIMNELKK